MNTNSNMKMYQTIGNAVVCTAAAVGIVLGSTVVLAAFVPGTSRVIESGLVYLADSVNGRGR